MRSINVKIALKYKVSDNATMIDKIIAKGIQIRTKDIHYHVELILDNMWISADPKEGICITPLKPYISDKWTIIDFGKILVTDEQYDKIHKFIFEREGNPYDMCGIFLSQFIKLGMDDKNKWFCSEIVSKILQLLLIDEYIDITPADLSPADMYRLSKYRLGHKDDE